MEDFIKSVAQQLRKPEGEMGIEIGERMNKGNYEMNKNTIQLLAPAAGDNILEIGMGNGHFIKEITGADPSVRYTGCDYSELMVKEAIERNKEEVASGRVNIQHGTANALPFPDNSFNKIFTVNTVYFWEDPAKELAEISRVLQPAGKLFLAFRSEDCMKHIPFAQHNFTLYTRERLSELLTTNGFRIEGIIENKEPSQEMHGEPMPMDHILITASTTNF